MEVRLLPGGMENGVPGLGPPTGVVASCCCCCCSWLDWPIGRESVPVDVVLLPGWEKGNCLAEMSLWRRFTRRGLVSATSVFFRPAAWVWGFDT